MTDVLTPAPGNASSDSADRDSSHSRRWKSLTWAAGILIAVTGAWGKDVTGVRTSTCSSKGFRAAVRTVHVSEHVERDLGPVSCPTGTWVATQEESEDVVDTFLARASSASPGTARILFTAQVQKSTDWAAFGNERASFSFLSHWGRINWAQRVGDVSIPTFNEVSFMYQVFEAPDSQNVPSSAMVKWRGAHLRLAPDIEGFKIDEVKDLEMGSTPEAEKDHRIDLPRVTLVADTRPRRLPSEHAFAGVYLDSEEGRTVRLICRSEASQAWIRTTDGFVPADTLPPVFDADRLPLCQPQFATRAAAGKEY